MSFITLRQAKTYIDYFFNINYKYVEKLIFLFCKIVWLLFKQTLHICRLNQLQIKKYYKNVWKHKPWIFQALCWIHKIEMM